MRVAVSLGLLFLLYYSVDLNNLKAVLFQIHPVLVIVLLMLLLLNTLISASKWKLLLIADGIDISMGRLIASYLVGNFLSLFLPSNIGGDAYRVYDVAQYSKRGAHSFASVLADRLSGFVALVLLGFSFGIYGFRHLPHANVLLVPLIAFFFLAATIGILFQQRIIIWFFEYASFACLKKIKLFVVKLLDSVGQYRTKPGLFARILLMSFVFQFNIIICIYIMALSLNIHVDLIYFCIFIPIISLIEALPVSIYGLGLRDATYVFFFTNVGMKQAQALILALSYVIISFVYSSFGGLILLFRSKPRKT